MADVTWTRLDGNGNSDVFEVVFDATNKTTPILSLDPAKDTTLAIKTTGTATVAVTAYLENPANGTPIGFALESAAATASSEDYIVSNLGPISGLDFAGTVSGGDGATIQVMQSQKK